MMDYICGPPSPGSEPSLLAARGFREGMEYEVWVCAGRTEDASSMGGGPSTWNFRLLLISGAKTMVRALLPTSV